MKVVSITMVKNEVDIIESFIRYNSKIVDEMIILDNGSTDDTVNVINNLINEGLSIALIHDEDSFYNQDVKMTKLLHKAVYDFDADIICVIDADEFISSSEGNPREIIENLDLSTFYHVKWVTYVITGDENNDVKFIPSKFDYIRDEKYEYLYKVIVPAEIVKNHDVSLEMGNHNLVFHSDKNVAPNIHLDLKICHFPLRSKEQAISKIIVGWPNVLHKYLDNNMYGIHWKLFFEKIRQTSSISDEDLELFSKNYSFKRFGDDIEIKRQPMNLDFWKDIEIKYDYEYNCMANVLDNYVYMSTEVFNYQKDIKLLKKENKQLKKELNEMKNSSSWKMTKPLRKIGKIR